MQLPNSQNPDPVQEVLSNLGDQVDRDLARLANQRRSVEIPVPPPAPAAPAAPGSPATSRSPGRGLWWLAAIHAAGLVALGVYWFGIRRPPSGTPAPPDPAPVAASVIKAEMENSATPFTNNEVEEKEAEDLQFMVVKNRAGRALNSRDRNTVQQALQLLRGLRTVEARQLREQLTRHLDTLPAE